MHGGSGTESAYFLVQDRPPQVARCYLLGALLGGLVVGFGRALAAAAICARFGFLLGDGVRATIRGLRDGTVRRRRVGFDRFGAPFAGAASLAVAVLRLLRRGCRRGARDWRRRHDDDWPDVRSHCGGHGRVLRREGVAQVTIPLNPAL